MELGTCKDEGSVLAETGLLVAAGDRACAVAKVRIAASFPGSASMLDVLLCP